jgi:hypothetical protein
MTVPLGSIIVNRASGRAKVRQQSNCFTSHWKFIWFGLLFYIFQVGNARSYSSVVQRTFPFAVKFLAITSRTTAALESNPPPPSTLPSSSTYNANRKDKPNDVNEQKQHESNSESSYLLLCLTDGRIYSLQAWTGEYQSVIQTHPLLQSNYFDTNEDYVVGSNMIFPGLDGRLYWRPPLSRTSGSSGSNGNNRRRGVSTSVAERDDDRSPTSSPPLLPPLQELPLTVSDLLENPVRSCDPEKNGECSILTAQAITSLLALSSTGQLLWQSSTSSAKGKDRASSPNDESSPLLLQRKDYWVKIRRTISWTTTIRTGMVIQASVVHCRPFCLPTPEKPSRRLIRLLIRFFGAKMYHRH